MADSTSDAMSEPGVVATPKLRFDPLELPISSSRGMQVDPDDAPLDPLTPLAVAIVEDANLTLPSTLFRKCFKDLPTKLEVNAKVNKPTFKASELPDLTQRLIDCGSYKSYCAWREGYRRWRNGSGLGAEGEVSAGDSDDNNAWRDQYRKWRQGKPKGARGESTNGRRYAPLPEIPKYREKLPSIVYDVVASKNGVSALVPIDGPRVEPILVTEFPPESIVTIRVFRFFEDRERETYAWEQGLHNVNSGSLFWLPVHMAPDMHSKRGAKYGTWFTIHYIQVCAKHFKSAYHMANEGCLHGCETFGATRANTDCITGEELPVGYFWYVSPASGREHLRKEGWQHLGRAGPFDGEVFLELWLKDDRPTDHKRLQHILGQTAVAARQETKRAPPGAAEPC